MLIRTIANLYFGQMPRTVDSGMQAPSPFTATALDHIDLEIARVLSLEKNWLRLSGKKINHTPAILCQLARSIKKRSILYLFG